MLSHLRQADTTLSFFCVLLFVFVDVADVADVVVVVCARMTPANKQKLQLIRKMKQKCK